MYLPNTNTNTSTNTNTTTNTLTRYVTNTNTTTNTVTNTATNTSTTTVTATKTYGTDADSDGFLQTSEIDPTGSDYLFIDEADNQTANFTATYDIEQMIVQGDSDLGYIFGDGDTTLDSVEGEQILGAGEEMFGDGNNITITQEIEQPVYTFEAYNDYNSDPGNLSVDDNYTVDLGGNIQVVQVFEDGTIEIQQDFMQTIDQDIVQDVFYEVELIQDIVQDVDINQTYTVDQIVTETRTRLVGE